VSLEYRPSAWVNVIVRKVDKLDRKRFRKAAYGFKLRSGFGTVSWFLCRLTISKLFSRLQALPRPRVCRQVLGTDGGSERTLVGLRWMPGYDRATERRCLAAVRWWVADLRCQPTVGSDGVLYPVYTMKLARRTMVISMLIRGLVIIIGMKIFLNIFYVYGCHGVSLSLSDAYLWPDVIVLLH